MDVRFIQRREYGLGSGRIGEGRIGIDGGDRPLNLRNVDER